MRKEDAITTKKTTVRIDTEILLEALMSSVDELIVVVNADGYIEAMSKAYADFLHVNQKTIIGHHISEVIENTRMDIIVKTGIAETGEIQEVNGEKMIANCIPIFKDGQVVGAFGRVLLRNARHLQKLYDKMNSIEMKISV